jgi:ATP-dependent DNA helicase RecG
MTNNLPAGLPDSEIIATVISLANTEGGTLLLGVEDDGRATGLHPKHQSVDGLAALIANRTNPAVSVRIELGEHQGKRIAVISVPKSRQLTATSDGLLLRRRIMANGRPEAVPFYPTSLPSANPPLACLTPVRWSSLMPPWITSMDLSGNAFAKPYENMGAILVCYRCPMMSWMAPWV